MSEYHDRTEKPRQYRLKCGNCGSETSENLRMHSNIPRHYAKRKLNDDPEKSLSEVNLPGDTYVQCNNCGNIRSTTA